MATSAAIRPSCCAAKSCYSYAAGLPAESKASSEGMMRRIALGLVFVAVAATQSLISTRAAGLYFPPAAGEWARVHLPRQVGTSAR